MTPYGWFLVAACLLLLISTLMHRVAYDMRATDSNSECVNSLASVYALVGVIALLLGALIAIVPACTIFAVGHP